MVKNEDDVTKMQHLDMHLWLVEDILLKADKMSMAHSIELRVPFLDKEVMKAAAKVPSKYRVNNINTKYAFRLAARRALPAESANRKKLDSQYRSVTGFVKRSTIYKLKITLKAQQLQNFLIRWNLSNY